MFNMASVRIVFLCIFIGSLIPYAISGEQSDKVECSKYEIEAQFGTSTLLNCSVQTKQIFGVSWKLNNTEVLAFRDGKPDPKDPRFQFAKSSWDKSNKNVSLLIPNTNLSHAGVYHCDVMANDGNNGARVDLSVKAHYSKPVILRDPENIPPDKDFTLTCETHGGFPQGHIRWVVNDLAWTAKPEEKVRKTSDGLYNLTSSLSFGPHSVFTKFVCEVYDASNKVEGHETYEIPPLEHSKGSDTKEQSVSHIVAPLVVIGSLIVGLLVVLVCRLRKQRNVPMPEYSEENNRMV